MTYLFSIHGQRRSIRIEAVTEEDALNRASEIEQRENVSLIFNGVEDEDDEVNSE